MDRKALLLAAGWGIVLQLAMVIAGHFVPFIADYLFAIGGFAIAVAAGFVYGRSTGRKPALGGAAAGAIGAFLGIAVSVALGDVPPLILLVGTAAAAIGGFGGAVWAEALRARRRRS